ncbi:unnamed protein product [Mytilus coruscus]|uniref:C2H2-type domain-containing protein n=1 Tax=Mytilus coruscus TaxID=42192 RepID=A0A6J8EB56_MYTCO|nr:unnamed protein product [Mytilus coruscus]
MSRELVLVPKRKYDDLIRRAGDVDKRHEKDVGGEEKDIDRENQQQNVSSNQHGYGDTVLPSSFEAIGLVMDIDEILTDSALKYPDGSNAHENELRTLKRNLNDNKGFTCGICNKVIQHRNNFNRHLKSHETTHKCFLCNRKFTRIDTLKRHEADIL